MRTRMRRRPMGPGIEDLLAHEAGSERSEADDSGAFVVGLAGAAARSVRRPRVHPRRRGGLAMALGRRHQPRFGWWRRSAHMAE